MQRGFISLRGCTKRFAGHVAVDNLSLDVCRGEIFVLVGPDGAGKTTTLRMLAGLVDADAGEIVVAGHDRRRMGTQQRDAIGYMAQRFGLYRDLTVDENMSFYADLFGIPSGEREPSGRALLQITRMEPFRDRRAGQLSGGMKQKLALICTLLHRPEVLLLDEPTTGVDPVSRREFWTILYGLVRDGLTVFVTTAYLDEAERANNVGLLYKGRLIRCDTPEALRRSMSEKGFRVEGPALPRVRAALEGCDGVVSVTRFGTALHLYTAPDIRVEHLVENAGLDSGDAVRFIPITPSLEDVFVTEVRKAASRGGSR